MNTAEATVTLSAAEFRAMLAETAELKRKLAQANLRVSHHHCAAHAAHRNPLPCPHCMADWIVSVTNAYAQKDWEAIRATLTRTIQRKNPKRT